MNVVVAHTDARVRGALSAPLRASGFEVSEAADFEQALRACQELGPDVALVSEGIQSPAGGTLLDEVKAHPEFFSTAVILVAPAAMPFEQAEDLLARGAQDMLVEPVTPAEVVARVRSAARTKTLQDELVKQGRRLATMLHEDPLTGLFNRRYVLIRLGGLISGARRHRRPLSVAMVDVDRFKHINDECGHDVGDAALVEIASAVRARLRAEDELGRVGGEEFLVLLPDTDESAAGAVAEDLRASVAATRVRCNGRVLHTTVSVGWATWDGDESPDRLVKRADVALYAAKNAGRNRVRGAQNGSAASLPRRT